MNEQICTLVQLLMPSAVTLLVAVAGIVSTCVAAKVASRSETEKAIVLRFVEMFESAIEGLSKVSDIYVSWQTLLSANLTKESLALKIQTLLGLSQACADAGKITDPVIMRLNIYFPDPGHECFDSRAATTALFELIAEVSKVDRQMKTEGRTTITDDEYKCCQELEKKAAEEMRPLQQFYVKRREYFMQCYAVWRRKNISFIKRV